MHSLRSIALEDWNWDDEDQSGDQRRARDLNAELLKVPAVVTEAVTQTDYQADSRRKFNT